MWKQIISEVKLFLIYFAVMLSVFGGLYISIHGHPYIGISLMFVVPFLMYGGWQWMKEHRQNAMAYLIFSLITYFIIIAVAQFMDKQ